MKKFLGIFLCFMFVISGCGSNDDTEDKTTDKEEKEEEREELTSLAQFQETYPDDQPVAIVETDKGKMVIVLFPEYAPKAVENFSTHAKNGYYDGLKFHRVMKDFMVQTGDPLGNGTGGESIWGGTFGTEISYELFHFKGALAMARGQSEDSQGSQFYIVQGSGKQLNYQYDKIIEDKYAEVGGVSSLDGQYTVFGQTIEGLDVLDALASVEVKESATGEMSTPVEDIHIIKITMTTYGEYKAQ
ncbi:cyclophilin family peptidyl-prolyl cis-trans isomerase [Breznakia sp. PF5-3]|uniref:peptidylprolyl isomerase n=1 Tax=unclassified Breznakia TaxID=2623764 RepID=UPI002405A783|nr:MULTISPECIES: peptidylprolyl isomerase [unclassified Breznakia]MDF9824240.1 cyclophilin family peptidyl-prolyl cis-trans isomerase [Breznakia sp. PM6-1]MDF9835193.1 cyclophilin family peptidyl-prolyl cis-trans isomerase [Breznakia sp. PF5-3]MDF9837305.1 cyclophilin family peptidyl-prolyl cis-trans isomerase [Breznakia sp. PFB2-8]MDF9859440.1 cyclophilin family peptidyl-prolyl cis-trans isomerase [Breznakia sp. PH5-24]